MHNRVLVCAQLLDVLKTTKVTNHISNITLRDVNMDPVFMILERISKRKDFSEFLIYSI